MVVRKDRLPGARIGFRHDAPCSDSEDHPRRNASTVRTSLHQTTSPITPRRREKLVAVADSILVFAKLP